MGDDRPDQHLADASTIDLGPLENGADVSNWRRTHVALYRIVDEVDGRIITSTGARFDSHAYSRFKYGWHQQAHWYGEDLTRMLLSHPIADHFRDKQPVVVSASAYKRLSTAAQFVASTIETRLRWTQQYPVHAARIHRAQLTEGDYGTMTIAERQYWMSNNGLSVDTALFNDRHVVIVDDVRITGSHEKAIWRLLADLPIRSVTNLYVVDLDSDLAKRDPTIEDRMNHAAIRNLSDLYRLMQEESYVPTARTVKFVLSRPLDSVKTFLERIEGSDLRLLHLGVLDDGYYSMDTYADGSMLLLREVKKRKRAAARRRYRGPGDEYWRDWDPEPYSGPIPGKDERHTPPPVPTLHRTWEFSLFGHRVTVRRDA